MDIRLLVKDLTEDQEHKDYNAIKDLEVWVEHQVKKEFQMLHIRVLHKLNMQGRDLLAEKSLNSLTTYQMSNIYLLQE
jgi:hypothetical protein